MGAVFGKVLGMSLVGCYSILVVMLVRLFLKRLERKYVYFLWFIVFFNLSVPLSLKVGYSLIPDRLAEWSSSVWTAGNLWQGEQGSVQTWQKDMVSPENNFGTISGLPEGESFPEGGGLTWGSLNINAAGGLEERETTALFKGVMAVWLAGMTLILGIQLEAVFRLKKRIARENWVRYSSKKRIAEVRGIDTPFLWGFWRPIIYLPMNMEPEERKYVIAHEQFHRRRKDYLTKIVFFLIVTLHWFNPLVWAAYRLCCKDMEISCDEAVLQQFEGNIRKQYAESLLKYAAAQSGYATVSLTFGEPAVKARIKNVLRFKKRGIIISLIAVFCVSAVTVGLFLRPKEVKEPANIPSLWQEGQSEAAPMEDEVENTEQEPSSASWYGSYVVTDYYPQGISALSIEDMDSMLGRSCIYRQERFVSGENVLEQPVYKEESVSKEDFAAGFNQRITFETLDITGDFVLAISVENSYDFGSSFYMDEEGNILIYYEGVFFKTGRAESAALVLEEADKEFLKAMCRYVPDFTGYNRQDDAFWQNFIFCSFTCPEVDEAGNPLPVYGVGEWDRVWREELGFEELVLKITEEDVREYAALAFGVEMPEFHPEFARMEPGQTSLYWEEGCYYIGTSDFPDYQYYFKDCQVHEEENMTYATV